MRESMLEILDTAKYEDASIEERARLLSEDMSAYVREAKDEMIASDFGLAEKIQFLKDKVEQQKVARQPRTAPQ